MAKRDYYEILGVERSVDAKEIKKAYRRLAMGRDLPSWHPLLTGSKQAMHENGMSVQNKIVCETKVVDIEDHIVIWPLRDMD